MTPSDTPPIPVIQAEGLKPCPNPWCESHEHGAVPELPEDLWTIDGSNAVRVGCPSCEMLGPHRSTDADAIAAWNTRHRIAAIEPLRDQLAETQMLATKWMEAHDKLKAGKPYSCPKPADLPDTITELVEALAEACGCLSNIPAPHSHPLWCRMLDAIRKGEEAIARAKGEQP